MYVVPIRQGRVEPTEGVHQSKMVCHTRFVDVNIPTTEEELYSPRFSLKGVLLEIGLLKAGNFKCTVKVSSLPFNVFSGDTRNRGTQE